MIFVWYGRLDVKDGAFVVIDKNGIHEVLCAAIAPKEPKISLEL